MIKEITAKTLLATVRQPDPWFGLRYNMNLYRGCQHQCIYCDSRSECYQIEDFSDILVKVNAVELLRSELRRKRIKGTIGFGSMNDAYMPIEAQRRLTMQSLEAIVEYGFPVHILTKSDLVLRDVDLLKQIAKVYAAVSFSITTADDDLGKKIEPGAAPVSQRFQAMAELARQSILTGVTMMPILPFIEDNEENLMAIVTQAKACGASYIIPSFGMSLRDRQRAYYYAQLDRLFPGMRTRYEQQYGEKYHCPVPGARRLELRFSELCQKAGIALRMPLYQPVTNVQLRLL